MTKTFLNPSEMTSAVINMGMTRGNEKNNLRTLISGFAAGVFIAVAGIGQLSATQTLAQNFDGGFAKFLGACIFPVGLMLCVFTGASLFTGNSLLTLSFLTKKLSFFNLLKNIVLVWIGNFLGSIFVAYVSFFGGIFSSPAMEKALMQTVTSKISLSFSQALFSGFLCNLLVAMGVIMAMCATDAVGKLFACWFPIMLFVVSGYQHVVANMYILSLGKLISWESVSVFETFVNHIIPVTVGNFLSGGVFIPVILYYLYAKDLEI